jgi:ribosomal protein L16 Arg81 hydroxylase
MIEELQSGGMKRWRLPKNPNDEDTFMPDFLIQENVNSDHRYFSTHQANIETPIPAGS